MERYRLCPHKKGIAISVPHIYGELVARVTREAPIVIHLEQGDNGGGRHFVNNEKRWGLGGELEKEIDERTTIYVANLFTPGSRVNTSRSIHLLGLALSPLELLDEDHEAPLVHVNGLLSDNGFSDHDMSIELSPRMAKLLERFMPEHHRRVEEAMRNASLAIGLGSTYPFVCKTVMGLGLVVPGDATWLACDESPQPGRVTRMGGHNIDNTAQQFTLLTGLAEAQAVAEEIDASS